MWERRVRERKGGGVREERERGREKERGLQRGGVRVRKAVQEPF